MRGRVSRVGAEEGGRGKGGEEHEGVGSWVVHIYDLSSYIAGKSLDVH